MCWVLQFWVWHHVLVFDTMLLNSLFCSRYGHTVDQLCQDMCLIANELCLVLSIATL